MTRWQRALLIGLAIGLALAGGFSHVISPVSAQDGTDQPLNFALRQAADFLSKKIGKRERGQLYAERAAQALKEYFSELT